MATQRNNVQFRRLWKRSFDGNVADHNGGYTCAWSIQTNYAS
jgi:hypothetical protein